MQLSRTPDKHAFWFLAESRSRVRKEEKTGKRGLVDFVTVARSHTPHSQCRASPGWLRGSRRRYPRLLVCSGVRLYCAISGLQTIATIASVTHGGKVSPTQTGYLLFSSSIDAPDTVAYVPLSLTHSLTRSLTHSLTHSLTQYTQHLPVGCMGERGCVRRECQVHQRVREHTHNVALIGRGAKHSASQDHPCCP